MKNMKNIYLSLSLGIILGFSGCGSTDVENLLDPSAPISVSGKAVDGYLAQSTVCLDLDLNGECNTTTEPSAITDVNGSYSFEISVEQQSHANYDEAPILVYGGYDVDTNTDFTGKLKAEFDASTSVNITPITTMLQAMIQDANMTQTQARESVRVMFGLSDDTDLDADPIAEAQTNPLLLQAALQLQKSIEVLSEFSQDMNSSEDQDDLIEDLYSSFAIQLQTRENDSNETNNSLGNLVSLVATQKNLNNEAGSNAIAVLNMISTEINGNAVGLNTALVATQISSIQNTIITEVIENNDSDYDIHSDIDDVTSDGVDFMLLHAYEILHEIDYDGNESADTMATTIVGVLGVAGMDESSLLSIEDEIAALLDDNATNAIGLEFQAKIQRHGDEEDENEMQEMFQIQVGMDSSHGSHGENSGSREGNGTQNMQGNHDGQEYEYEDEDDSDDEDSEDDENETDSDVEDD